MREERRQWSDGIRLHTERSRSKALAEAPRGVPGLPSWDEIQAPREVELAAAGRQAARSCFEPGISI